MKEGVTDRLASQTANLNDRILNQITLEVKQASSKWSVVFGSWSIAYMYDILFLSILLMVHEEILIAKAVWVGIAESVLLIRTALPALLGKPAFHEDKRGWRPCHQVLELDLPKFSQTQWNTKVLPPF